MMGAPQNDRPDCFWQADLDLAAGYLVEVIREVRPQVLVTYDPDGGYGHPDHIMAHRVAMRAAELSAEPAYRRDLGGPHSIAKVYWNCVPRRVVEEGFARLHAAGRQIPFEGIATADDVPGVVDDDLVTAAIDVEARYAEHKAAAMKAHVTQIAVDGPFFALSNDLGQPLFGAEFYRLVKGVPAPAGSLEDDLFAGTGA
jgi:N-acetyl-1-D-myo-inositol-2-amino-2-deoxy-alpha-D-glucopyranoside deacetylase